MKTRKFIFRKLISGKVKLTPEVLRGLKELGAGEGAGAEKPKPGEFLKPKRPPAEPPKPDAKQACDSKRLILVSLLPGRWTRCSAALIVCLFALSGHAMSTANGLAVFEAANLAFAQGRFAEAESGFQTVLATDGYSAPVLFNLANAQVGEGKLGPAILSYERALTLAPNDPDIAANLKLARSKAGLGKGEPTPLSRFTHSLSLNNWGSLAAGALLVFCAIFPLRRVVRRGAAALGVSGTFASVALMTALFALVLRWADLDRAVVTTKNCPARISPAALGETVFSLPEGDEVTLRKTRGDFALIQSRAGRRGWVKRDAIGLVLASVGR